MRYSYLARRTLSPSIAGGAPLARWCSATVRRSSSVETKTTASPDRPLIRPIALGELVIRTSDKPIRRISAATRSARSCSLPEGDSMPPTSTSKLAAASRDARTASTAVSACWSSRTFATLAAPPASASNDTPRIRVASFTTRWPLYRVALSARPAPLQDVRPALRARQRWYATRPAPHGQARLLQHAPRHLSRR